MRNYLKILLLVSAFILIGFSSTAQEREISGKVTESIDGTSLPLPGVNVIVKGTSKGTVTDMDGNYTLQASPADILVFSFLGYSTKEIQVGDNREVNVSLSSDVSQLNELVVVGYGKQKKINVTGAVSTVNEEAFENRPITNVSSALQGMLPGVTVLQRSGQPGKDGAFIRIRGLGSFNNNDPMIIVDGVEASLTGLNPNDISTVSVLKDASAAAIYGTRAANGVVVITTKRGEIGDPQVTYSTNIGVQELTRTPNFLGSYEHAKLLNEGYINEGLEPIYTPSEIEKFRTGSDPNYPNTKWIDLIYRGSGIQQTHDLRVSGGTEKARYMVSLGYLDQEGVIERTNTERYNLRFNLDSKVSENFHVGLNSAISRKRTNEPTAVYIPGQDDKRYLGWIIRNTFRIPPTARLKDDDGNWFMSNVDGNPVYWLREGGNALDKITNVFATPFAELKLFDGLTLRGQAGVDGWITDSKIHNKSFTYGDGTVQGERAVEDRLSRELRITLQSTLNYSKSIGNHNLETLLGVSRESWSRNYTMAFRSGFPRDNLTDLDAGSEEADKTNGYRVESKLGSYFGRLNYNYKEKYLLEVSARYDGSSKFAEDVRWGLFPSASIGWRISEESFMEDVEIINDLKLRASYGTLGNHNIGSYYQYIPLINLGNAWNLGYNFGGTAVGGAAQIQSTVKDLTWERTTIADIGVEVSMFDRKLNFEVDYYDKYSDDILAYRPLPATWAYAAPIDNLGAMRNKGVEFLINHRNEIGDFSYSASFNMGVNDNKVEKYPNPTKANNRIQEEGYAWNSYYGLEAIGFYQNQEEVENLPKILNAPVQPGDIIFKDQNGDGEISLDEGKDDRVVLGSEMPNITYGLQLNFGYKGFNLSMIGQGAADVSQAIPTGIKFPFQNNSRAREEHLNRWTPQTPNAENPRTLVNSGDHNKYFSSYLIEDASYFRLKNIQLGYTIPEKFIQGLGVQNVNIYLSGQNLLTITDLTEDFDPEASGVVTSYPNVKTYSAGFNISL